jgi:aspartate kinase
MKIKVCKFGGSSVASAEQIKKVKEIILKDHSRKIVVVSAPGRNNKGEEKITDLLIKCAEEYFTKKIKPDFYLREIEKRFLEISSGLEIGFQLVKELRHDLEQRLKGEPECPVREIDSIKALGEEYNARIIAEYISREGINCRYLSPREAGLLVTDEFGQANVLEESYARLARLKNVREVIIFPGFYGFTKSGEIATFSRGGSDLTGTILAYAVDAEVYENFTDVDGIFAADPQIVKNPAQIKELTYRELRELSCAGFKVFHDEAMYPAMRKSIPINVRNTNNYLNPGTWVVAKRKPEKGKLTGIACRKGFCNINVEKYLMNREIGFGRRLFQILEERKISYEHSPSGIDNISVILKQDQLSRLELREIAKEMKQKLKADTVTVEENISLITVVGEGIKQEIGIAARTTAALARASVNIEMISQGASEISILLGVKEGDEKRAVRSLYQTFFG